MQPTFLHKKRIKNFFTIKQKFFFGIVTFGLVLLAGDLLSNSYWDKLFAYDGTEGPVFTKQTWPAGTFLSHFNEGDRINSYHRNYFMMCGQQGTGIYDISNPTDPKRIQYNSSGNNGHRWWKINDLFYREYSVPEVAGTGFKYMDLSDMLNRKPVTASSVLYNVKESQPQYDKLETFPHTIEANRIYDMRTGEFLGVMPQAIAKPDVMLRMGNYVFYTPQTGAISVFDFGDPKNVKFLGSFGADVVHEQYSTGIQVWKNYIIMMNGNEGPTTLVAFDISDPRNVKHGFSLGSDKVGQSRYMMFQDEFGFAGRFNRGVKVNLETKQVVQEFIPPSTDEPMQFIDNQWMPIGHVVVASGDGKTSLFAHQDGLDTKAPYVGFHFPSANETNLPITSTLGFVINETLNDVTLTDKNIQVRPLGGDAIQGDISSASYNVINYAPRKPLLPNTTYEVKFVQGGIKDAVGNGIKEYIFYFTTGSNASNKSPVVSGLVSDLQSPMATGSTIKFTTTATDAEGNTLTYRWDFGDGTAKTGWITAQTDHTFTEAGNYNVQVQVSDNNGGLTVSSINISVVDPITGDLPTQSGAIKVDAAKRIVWSVNPDNNSVSMINADALTLIKEVPVGLNPVSVALDSKAQVWVACRNSDELYVLSAVDGSILKKVALPRASRPFGIVFTPNGNRGFVSAYGSGDIIEIAPITATVVTTLKLGVGTTPRAMAVNGTGTKLLVTRFISADQGGQIWEIDLATFAIGKTIALATDQTTVDNGNAGRGIPNYVAGITIHPNNKMAWSVAKKDNILRGLSRDGKPLVFDNSVRNAVSSIDLTTGTEKLPARIDIDNHGEVSAALYSPTGNYLFVTMQGNNSITVIDPKTGLQVIKKEVGRAPQGLAIDPVTKRLFVENFMGRSVTIFNVKQMIETGANNINELATVKTITTEKLSAQVFQGKSIFYNASDLKMGTDGYVSCASCHIDGGHDGRTWDFTDRGEGLRNTISLIGRAGMGHGNVHWSANFDEIQDFENDMRNHFKGRGFMSDADFKSKTTALTLGDNKAGKSIDLDALAAYVTSLATFDPSPHRNTDGTLTVDAVAGKAVFQTLKCGSCHAGNNFTDSKNGLLHDVGTINNTDLGSGKKLLGIDVPTLRDVWSTAPYLHDGSAATLKDVFTTRNANNAHGATSTLTVAQINQLAAYVQQIDATEEAAGEGLSLQMASPINGSTINKDEDIKLSVATNITGITKIEYYIDNDLFGTAIAAPFELKWRPLLWKNYSITARVFYNAGKTASITPAIKTRYKNPVNVLFVVGDDDIKSEDLKIKNRLEEKNGFNITVISDDNANRPEVANPYDLVLISSSVDPGILGNDMETVLVPLVTWDPFMYSKLRLTANTQTSSGFTPTGYQAVDLVNKTHPMSAGITTSTVNMYSITQNMPYGLPDTGAIIIAKAGTYPIMFGYEAGGGSGVSSRRVAFPLRDQFIHVLNDDGWKLFDAAVIWALYGGNAQTPIKSLPDVHFVSPVEGDRINLPLKVDFVTEGWSLPSSQYRLRFRIDGQDRGIISNNGTITEGMQLSVGPHKLMLQMERSNNFLTNLGDTITVNVTNDPIPAGPTVVVQSPTDGSLVPSNFDLKFTLSKWTIAPAGDHIRYYIDGVDKGAIYEVKPIGIIGLTNGDHIIKLVPEAASGVAAGTATTLTVTADKSITQIPASILKLEYRDNSSAAQSTELKPVFNIVNDSSLAIAYKDLTIRYWYTPESTNTFSFATDYSAVTGTIASFGSKNNVNSYVELGFTNAGSLNAKSKSGEIQTRISQAGSIVQNQSNDQSYDPLKKVLKLHPKVTLYYKGVLVWGLEPGGAANAAPIVNLTTTVLDGKIPLKVDFNASASTDPEGKLLTYAWNFGNQTAVATGAIATYTYTVAGTYTMQLTVTDADGVSAITTKTITARPDNSAPTAISTASATSGQAPLTVTFNGSASTDPDADVLTYSWNFADGTPVSTIAKPSHIFTTAGTYKVVLTVSDGKLASTSQVTIVANALGVNTAPLAKIVATPISGTKPLLVSFSGATSTDADGDPLTYSWNFGDTTAAGTGVTVNHTYINSGIRTAMLTISDGRGGVSTAQIAIQVNEPIVNTACNFGLPAAVATPSTNKTYTKLHVLGTNGPVLTNVTSFTLNWDLANKGLYQFSILTNNGVPGWYIDLMPKIKHTLAVVQPAITITGSGITGLDGDYWVGINNGNFVMVSKTKGFTIYANSTVAPVCTTLPAALLTALRDVAQVSPNPSSSEFVVTLPEEVAKVSLTDKNGTIVWIKKIEKGVGSKQIKFGPGLSSGLYIVQTYNSLGMLLEVKKLMKN